MSGPLDAELLAERSASVVAHLDRVAAHLPADPSDLTPMSSATDTVVLHLWQAVQIVIDLAMSTAVRLGLGSPPTYGDAFRLLAEAGVIDAGLAERLARAAGFRNLIVHAYGRLELPRVHAMIADLLDRVASGDIRVVIDRTFPLAEAAEAHAYIESRQAFGRVVMTP